MTTLSLLDQIYEAAIVPERWETVCDLLSDHVEGFAAHVITVGEDRTFHWISSMRSREQMELFSRSPLRFQNVRAERHVERAPFSFTRDIDLMTAEELADDPIYNEFLRPNGLGWTMGDIIQEPSGHMIIFDLIRQTERGPFSAEHVARVNALRPDLARAALMSSRLAFQQAQNLTRTLSLLGLPAVVIGDGGAAIAMNPEMETMAPRIRTGSGNRLSIREPAANALLQILLDQVHSGQPPTLQSIPVPAGDDAPALILHLLPVKRNARDIFAKSSAVLIATPVGETGPADLGMISGLFDLTAAEARVAHEIARGTTVDDTARKLSISRETVRTHLKRIFSKTGTVRQSQLVMLLSGY